MSNRLFTPTYNIEGVTYTSKDGVSLPKAMNSQTDNVGVGKGLDANQYATKKTVAQGMLDVALLTANASQLKYVLSVGEEHEFYTVMLVLIISSLVLQVVVGVLFMIIGMMNINDPEQQSAANILNNIIVIFVFIISVLNVVLSSFGIENMNINPPGVPIIRNTTKIK
ncbi:ninjurin-2-like isoform X1 [Eriocheir sinensis]|uniref:ninjurin-2-like isoform X1 n=1 Tax=Eriocheir sinensis TaxID=95602 RepID=UPI0021C76512|nr:ninjurin-2-like isoform X1 [Eriocheir sinensis]